MKWQFRWGNLLENIQEKLLQAASSGRRIGSSLSNQIKSTHKYPGVHVEINTRSRAQRQGRKNRVDALIEDKNMVGNRFIRQRHWDARSNEIQRAYKVSRVQGN